jgi:hypothetical protein
MDLDSFHKFGVNQKSNSKYIHISKLNFTCLSVYHISLTTQYFKFSESFDLIKYSLCYSVNRL